MNHTTKTLVSVALLGLAGCAGDLPTGLKPTTEKPDTTPVGDPIDKPGNKPEDAVGDEDNTFDHMAGLGEEDTRDPAEIAKQREEEGSPEARARMHSCQKVQITTLRNLLSQLGVNLDATGNPPTAGQLLADGGTALGAANYAARMGEDLVWTAAGAAKQFDIFVQAAPEIIAAMPTLGQCMEGGVATTMFDEQGKCNEAAVTCLIGRPATAEHVALCDSLATSASEPGKGQAMAVAALLSAAHSCE